MLVQYVSDLHLEFGGLRRVRAEMQRRAPVLVLAGDVGHPFEDHYGEFMDFTGAMFDKVFLVAGNHEFYDTNHFMGETTRRLHDLARGAGVSFLDNSCETYRGRRFAGSTLWSRISDLQALTNDFRLIRNLSVEAYNGLHEDCVAYLGALPPEPGTVVVTHYLPSERLVAERYRRAPHSRFNQCYASDCDHLLAGKAAWFHGHTHVKSATRLNGVDVLCNPLGYPGENDTATLNEVFALQEPGPSE